MFSNDRPSSQWDTHNLSYTQTAEDWVWGAETADLKYEDIVDLQYGGRLAAAALSAEPDVLDFKGDEALIEFEMDESGVVVTDHTTGEIDYLFSDSGIEFEVTDTGFDVVDQETGELVSFDTIPGEAPDSGLGVLSYSATDWNETMDSIVLGKVGFASTVVSVGAAAAETSGTALAGVTITMEVGAFGSGVGATAAVGAGTVVGGAVGAFIVGYAVGRGIDWAITEVSGASLGSHTYDAYEWQVQAVSSLIDG